MNLWAGHRVTLILFLHVGCQGNSLYERYFGKCAPGFLSQSSASYPPVSACLSFQYLLLFHFISTSPHSSLMSLSPFNGQHGIKKRMLSLKSWPLWFLVGGEDPGFYTLVSVHKMERVIKSLTSRDDLFVHMKYGLDPSLNLLLLAIIYMRWGK